MLKVTIEKPRIFQVPEEVKNLLGRTSGRKKKEEKKPWSHRERLLVGFFLALTILGSVYFWYKGQGRLPSLRFGGVSFGETIILEK